jgi:hypothetical protein
MRPIVVAGLLLLTLGAAWYALRAGAADALLAAALGGAALPAAHAAIDAAPGYALILLGCYALATVGLSFLSFNDISGKAEELKAVRAGGGRGRVRCCGGGAARCGARARNEVRGLSARSLPAVPQSRVQDIVEAKAYLKSRGFSMKG